MASQTIPSRTVGSAYTTTAITQEKLATLAKKNPSLAGYIGSVFGVGISSLNATAGSINNAAGDFDRYTKNVLQTLFSAENYFQTTLGGTAGAAAESIGNFGGAATESIRNFSSNIRTQLSELLAPVSAFTGATLGTLTNILRDPLGAPFYIGQSIVNLVDKVNPGFANRTDATLKKYNIDNLQNLPSQVMGSINNLVQLIDGVLSLPFIILSDLYNGLMQLMSAIGQLIDDLISEVFNLIWDFLIGLLDSLVPISAFLELFQAVSDFVNIFSGITSAFGGFQTVNNFLGQIGNYTSFATSVLTNPQQLFMSYLPPQVNQVLSTIRNPQQFLESMIPPEVTGFLNQIGSVVGIGFTGNMGYGFGQALETLSQGVLRQVLGQYSQQAGILAPYLGLNSTPLVNTKQNYPPGVDTSPIGGQPVVQGVPVDLAPRPDVLPS